MAECPWKLEVSREMLAPSSVSSARIFSSPFARRASMASPFHAWIKMAGGTLLLSLSSNLFSRPRAIVKFSTLSSLRHRFRAQPVSFVCLFEQICRRRSLPAFRALDPFLLETRVGKNGGIRGTLMRRSNDLWKGDEYYYVMLLRCKTRYWNFVIETWFRAWPDPFE